MAVSVPPAGLRELDLQGCAALDGRALACLGALRQLSALCLDQCALLTDAHLPALAGCVGLRRLSLAGCRGVAGEGVGFSALAGLPALRELNLAGLERLGDGALAGLAGASALTALHLDLCSQLRCALLLWRVSL